MFVHLSCFPPDEVGGSLLTLVHLSMFSPRWGWGELVDTYAPINVFPQMGLGVGGLGGAC